jgi:hypothetical protein
MEEPARPTHQEPIEQLPQAVTIIVGIGRNADLDRRAIKEAGLCIKIHRYSSLG